MLRTASADNGGCGMQRYVTSRLGRHRELWHAMLHATSRATPWTVACSVTLRHVSANNVVCSMQCYVTPRHERLRGLRLAVLRYATSRATPWIIACSVALRHVSANNVVCSMQRYVTPRLGRQRKLCSVHRYVMHVSADEWRLQLT